MDDKLYLAARRVLYKKFDVLFVREDEVKIDLSPYDDEYSVIRIYKKFGIVYYMTDFKKKVIQKFPVPNVDFEILLIMWVEHKFGIKVKKVNSYSWYLNALL